MVCEADEMYLKVGPNFSCAMDFPVSVLAAPLRLSLSREIPFLPLVSSRMITFQSFLKINRAAGSLTSICFAGSAH